MTMSYTLYLIVAGLAASWYFLNGTPYFPEHPVLESMKRAFTSQFGSASFAGFIMAIIEILKSLANSGDGGGGIASLLRCIALCLLTIVECFVKWITRYGLIYCAIYGIPYVEGCRRWMELLCHRFLDVIVGGVIIGGALTFNEILFAIGAFGLGFGIGWGMFTGGDDFTGIIFGILVGVMAMLLTFAIFAILAEPILTLSDTLLVCFAEAPERLQASHGELHDRLAKYYGKSLQQRLQNPETKEQKKD
jgi:hypothetical protein